MIRAVVLLGCLCGMSPAEEDLRSVKQWFHREEPALSGFHVADKRAIDSTYSAMAVTGYIHGQPHSTHLGVFVVYGKTNEVYMVLDVRKEDLGMPRLERPDHQSVYVHLFQDYGLYRGTYKYVYDLLHRRPAKRYSYVRVPAEQIRPDLVKAEPDRELNIVGGRRLTVEESGIQITDRSGAVRAYPLPQPDEAKYGPAGFIRNTIGSFAFDGHRLWFATSFYDGEGMSGAGAVGSFDVAARRYEFCYLPEIVRWSGSALRLDGDDLWIGLMRQPEGAPYGGGVLRYNTASGSARLYPVKDLVNAIQRAGDVVSFGTDHGIYELDISNDSLVHIRLEPGPTGSRELVTRQVPGIGQ